MNILSVIPEKLKTAGRILFNGAPTGTGDTKGVLPATGSNGLIISCLVTMANTANLALSIETADDADGANAVAITENIPIFVDDVRQTDAKAYTETDDSATKTIIFCIPPVLIPAGKYICLTFGNSNVANILSAQVFDDAYNAQG